LYERSHHEREENASVLLNALQDPVFMMKPDETVLYVNESAASSLGLQTKDIPGMCMADFLPPELVHHHTLQAKQVVRTGRPSRYIDERNGRILEINLFPVFGDGGEVSRIAVFVRDITEKVQSERRIAENEEKYRHLAEAINDVIYTIDTEGNITYISPQVSRYGYSPDDLISRNMSEFIVEEDFSRVMEDTLKTLSTGESTITPFRFLDSSGKPQWVEDHGAAVFSPSGTQAGISGILRDITSHINAESALRESESKFRALVDNSLDGILIIDFSGTLLFANQAVGRILQVSDLKTHIGNTNVLKFVSPESRSDVIRDLHQVSQGIDTYLVMYKLITETGQEVWVECIGKKIPYEGSDANFISMRDITERMQIEESIRESETKFTALFQNSPVSLTLVSIIDGTFVDVNDAFLQGSGYVREDVIGKTSEEVGMFADPEEYTTMVAALRKQQRVYGMEMKCRTKSGEIRICMFTSGVIFMNGRPYVLSSVEDITDRKNAEMAIRESEERYRLIMNNAYEGIIVNELTPAGPGKFIDVNEEACRLIGITRDEVQTVKLLDLDTPEMQEKAHEITREIIKNNRFTFQRNYRTKEGVEKVFEITSNLIDLRGRPAVLSVFHEITERIKSEQVIRKANLQLNMLSGITRHDILNKISVMRGYLAIAEMDNTDPTLSEYLAKMKSAVDLIQSQIEFTRVYQDLGSHEPRWIELDTILPRSSIPDSVVLTADLHGIFIFADVMLEKVFFNLLDNSIRHGDHVTEIRVTATRAGDDLVVTWEDNGCGIAEDEKEKIFERGYGKNTGFGMYLVREILSLTDITIRETGVPGTGARFEILVPKGMHQKNTTP
jgi:PAS domain S-box-containing protein